jgi:hypothetical protein
MSNYVKATNFTAKDSLPSGNSGKIIKGAEIDTELTAVASAISSKADLNSPALTGTPTAPTASAGTNTTQVATTAFVKTAVDASFTTGMIMMWSGTIATIPSGWVLCNGSNSTPDLRNKFIIGAHSDTTGVAYSTITGSNTQTGGTKDAIVVSHTHTATVTDSGHTHTLPITGQSGLSGSTGNDLTTDGGTLSLSTNSATTGITVANSTEGSSGTNQNLPPYYALAFIMKT